ncbi:MAG: hypothetical protein Q7V53_05530 [Caldisericota bacterium]|nr:hypothetical protein [Caldisericota bacterium]
MSRPVAAEPHLVAPREKHKANPLIFLILQVEWCAETDCQKPLCSCGCCIFIALEQVGQARARQVLDGNEGGASSLTTVGSGLGQIRRDDSQGAYGIRANAIMVGFMDTPMSVTGIAQATGRTTEATVYRGFWSQAVTAGRIVSAISPTLLSLIAKSSGVCALRSSGGKRSGCGGTLPRPASGLRAPKVLIKPRSLSWNRFFSKLA